jgi:3-oxoacyl-(acyl-carrier-protein) synthase
LVDAIIPSGPHLSAPEGFVFSEGWRAGPGEPGTAERRGSDDVERRPCLGDGYHLAALDPEAAGPIRAMHWAMQDAAVSPDDVDYINAHGTSTKINDFTETRAIKAVFGERAYQIPISSTKSTSARRGGWCSETIASICFLYYGQIYQPLIMKILIRTWTLCPNEMRRANLRVALKNSFGLGGQNACLVLKSYLN